MKQLLTVLSFLFLLTQASNAQKVTYEGKITDMDSEKSMSGVTIRVLENGSEVTSSTTSSNGKYSVQFEPGKKYTIVYDKPGYVNKIIKIDVTEIFAEDMPPGGKIFPPVDIDLFTEREGADFSFLENEAVVEWFFDRDRMNFDRKKVSRVKKKISDRLLEAEESVGRNEAKYNALIQEADQLFNEESYDDALNKYVEALQVPGKEAEEHPNNRLLEIEGILQKKEEEELAYQQENQAYLNVIEAADNFAENEDYEKALQKYREAAEMKSDEQYPKDRILDIEKTIANLEKKDAYDDLITQADNFFNQNSLQAARDKYQEANRLLPDENYPKEQLDAIQDKLDAQSAQRQQKENYNKAIAAADKLYDDEDYAGAIEKYEEAISYESAATYPVERIKLSKTRLKELEDQQETKEMFNQLVADADQAVGAKNYELAIEKYDEALNLITDEDVEIKRSKAQDLLAAQKDKENKAQQIENLLASANANLTDQSYEAAISDFQAILEIEPQHAEAIEGKANAERLLAEKQNALAQENEFNELVEQADEKFENENWEEAKSLYISAKALIDDNEHVNNRLDEIRTNIENQNEQARIAEEIQVLLDQATSLKEDNEWSAVISKYEEALALDNSRNDVQDLLTAAQQSKKDFEAAQSKEEQFAQLKQEGETLFAAERWEEAKEKYEAALAIQDDSEIEERISAIEAALLAAEQERNQEQLYSQKMSEAESLANAESYEDALMRFYEALELKPDDITAKSRIADMEQKIEQLESQQEREEKYQTAMSSGKEAMDEEDYSAAIKFFDDALIEKPMDNEATRLKNEAKTLIQNLQSEEEVYNSLLADAQDKYEKAIDQNNNISQLKEAKSTFEEAQAMRPKASLPQSKIVEIDELLRQIEEEKEQENNIAEINRRYEEQLDLASVSAQNNRYNKAIEHLEEAAKLKPSETLPAEKIAEYQALIDQQSARNRAEQAYKSLVDQADLAFENESYDESIALYEEALDIKANEAYPLKQIEKAKQAKVNLANRSVNAEYQRIIDRADESFADERYEEALSQYESALEVKENDSYAKDQISETRQILDNLAQKKAKAAKNSAQFDAYISEADELFAQERFLDAVKVYEKALKINKNDAYALKQVQLSIEKEEEKTARGNEKRYQKILTKADEYFDDENYDKAISLYERALSLRATDQYPKDQLSAIQAIKNGNVKTNKSVEYLGEESNISIMEGAALLEAGAKQREQLKQERVQKQLQKNEGLAEERSASDYQERVKYENEITSIKDRRSSAFDVREQDHVDFINEIDEQEYQLELKRNQDLTFEQGAVYRMNQELIYIDDGMAEQKRKNSDNHLATIEKIKDIQIERDLQSTAEAAHHKVKVNSTRDELLKVDEKYDQFTAEQNEIRKDREVKVDNIERGRELRSFEEKNDEYEQVMQLQDDALLAEIKVAESQEDKAIIHQQLQDDIYALDAMLQRKMSAETVEAYQDQLLIDEQLTRAEIQYAEAQEGKDDARQLALEQLKDMDQKSVEQSHIRSDQQYEEVQDVVREVESVEQLNEAQKQKQESDLSRINEEVKSQERAMERANELRDQNEEIQRQNTVNDIERIKKQEEIAKAQKEGKIKQNHEDLKGLEASLDTDGQRRQEESRNKKIATQKMIDKLEGNKIKYSATIANTIGDQYPEGVSQENYVRKDDEGIPVKIVTRRFVVKDGRGDIYIRMQTRSGLTYSKNGTPITEQGWINGTENAKLEKHY
ncbi:hypothetical protein CW751_03545 [Brumimicrobium salinarum]|uniref:Tetratricopeptide repeat protein n=1 Tax=Brumimicrobium salinarum TaxID=2058658 RepID=A0A2I0R5G4_9FLAO|nr:tetratricopeptide repeat protein [Brumimicrobium salinarum]PKR81610.1 hypothetical protein CW751_03545 [Brumimicrobium salinarum]